MQSIHVNLGPRSYGIAVTHRDAGLVPFIQKCRPKMSGAFVVSDTNAKPHADRIAELLRQAGIKVQASTLPAGEPTKSLESTSRLYDELARWPADRQTLVVAVGGGVIGDLAGFAASTYNRGLPLFMAPTTLLAMVDSSVGGKVGINHSLGKNLIGAFHQPVGVWIDTAVLDTLPDREYRSGLAEVVKYGVILDADFFAWLEANVDAIRKREPAAVEHIVSRSCRLKADVVEQDEREETGLRMILNYGHTFAHAFEAIGGYGAWLHGEAVAAGMACASRLAELRGLIDSSVTARQIRLLQAFDLPTTPKSAWPKTELLASMYRDKKTQAGRLRFVLPTRLGEVKTFDDVPETQVIEALSSLPLPFVGGEDRGEGGS
jgi:3-dehydroquinate synthase